MKGMRVATGFMAVALLSWTAAARAGDTVRLSLSPNDSTPTQNLVADGQDTDTVLVGRGFGGGFRAGGFRAGGFAAGGFRAGGFRAGGFRVGGFGGVRAAGFRTVGFRGWGGSWGGRGWWGPGWAGRGWWGWGGYWPWYGYGYYGGYSPVYVDYNYYTPYIDYSVLSYGTPVVSPGVTVDVAPYSNYTAPAPTPSAPAVPPNGDGTYPYDGGPTNPVPLPRPMPKADPTAVPPAGVPLEGRPVSLTRGTSRWAYPAYGEAPRRTSFGQDRELLIKR
jgi:hypothetical protein